MDPIELILKLIMYTGLLILIGQTLWGIFLFIWIVVLQKEDYDRFLFWIKPKSKNNRKKKKRRRAKRK